MKGMEKLALDGDERLDGSLPACDELLIEVADVRFAASSDDEA